MPPLFGFAMRVLMPAFLELVELNGVARLQPSGLCVCRCILPDSFGKGCATSVYSLLIPFVAMLKFATTDVTACTSRNQYCINSKCTSSATRRLLVFLFHVWKP